jgi:hypothetical protein
MYDGEHEVIGVNLVAILHLGPLAIERYYQLLERPGSSLSDFNGRSIFISVAVQAGYSNWSRELVVGTN